MNKTMDEMWNRDNQTMTYNRVLPSDKTIEELERDLISCPAHQTVADFWPEFIQLGHGAQLSVQSQGHLVSGSLPQITQSSVACPSTTERETMTMAAGGRPGKRVLPPKSREGRTRSMWRKQGCCGLVKSPPSGHPSSCCSLSTATKTMQRRTHSHEMDTIPSPHVLEGIICGCGWRMGSLRRLHPPPARSPTLDPHASGGASPLVVSL